MKLATIGSRLINRLLPVVPARYRLPIVYWDHTRLGDCEPELRFLVKLVSSRDVALDIGANKGLYSYSLANIFSVVHAFEICPDHCRHLQDYRSPRITLHTVGLSNRIAKEKLYVPVLPSGWVLDGWASLKPGNCPDAADQIEKVVEVRPLDSFGFKQCSFLKIDVEGHELEVLEGGEKTIRATLPRILIEIREVNVTAVDRFLARFGYRRAAVEKLLGCKGAEGNYFYLPPQEAASRGL